MTPQIKAICDAASVAAEVVRTSQNHGHLANQLDDAVRELTEWECKRRNAIAEHSELVGTAASVAFRNNLPATAAAIRESWKAVTEV